MKYLHDHNIIHRDLKPGNVLLDKFFYPHITDFGLSKMFQTGHSYSQSQVVGTLPYMAPELFKSEKYDRKADVYSFGILMYEVITDMISYPELFDKKITDHEFRNRVMNDNYRPVFKFPIKESIRKLIEKCWSNDPSERPNFDEIFECLSSYQNEDNCILEDVDINELSIYVDDVCEVKDNIDHLLIKINELEKEIQNLKTEREQKDDEIETLQQENNQLKLNEEQKNKEIQRLKQIEEQKNKEIHELKQKEEQKNKEIQTLKQNEEQKNKEIQRLKQEVEQMNKEIQDLKQKEEQKNKEIQDLKQEVEQKNKEIQKFNSDDDKFRSSKSKTHEDPVSEFNCQSLKMQRSILSNIIESSVIKEPSFIKKILSLIDYLLELEDLRESTEVLELICPDNNLNQIDDKTQIRLKFIAVEILINNNYFESTRFIDILKSINQLYFEIKYPSESFDDIYEKVVDLQRSEQLDKNIKIGILISGIKGTNYKFQNNKIINYIILDATITTIKGSYPNGSFKGCSSLTQIIIPSSVTSIGSSSFSGCSSLTQISIPSSVTSIESSSFSGCSSLKQISIPSSVTSIGDYAFKECSSLLKIEIPSSVTLIGSSSFSECSSLCEILIPSSVTSIGNYAFFGCSSLTQIIIPSSVTEIGSDAFSGCSSLTQISISTSVTSIKEYTFFECSSLTKIRIPSSVTSIGAYAFLKCSSLSQILIPSSVTSVESSAFSGCSSLTQITIPPSVTEIGSDSFSGSSSLKTIPLPLFLASNRNKLSISSKIHKFMPFYDKK